jgi:hypothetical protein
MGVMLLDWLSGAPHTIASSSVQEELLLIITCVGHVMPDDSGVVTQSHVFRLVGIDEFDVFVKVRHSCMLWIVSFIVIRNTDCVCMTTSSESWRNLPRG